MTYFEMITIPPLAVNGFLWDTMLKLEPSLSSKYSEQIPFYPVGDSAAGDEPWDDNPYFIYDRVFRFSSSPFYEHKRESVLYYLKAKEVDSLTWSAALQMILDREDDSAKDVNAWIRDKWYKKIIAEAAVDGFDISNYDDIDRKILIDCYKNAEYDDEDEYDLGFNPRRIKVENDHPIFFHNLRVYQSRSSSPSSDGKIREISTVQPYYITEFMVDSHFHFTKTFDEYMEDARKRSLEEDPYYSVES
jgi:hypothetical protein